MQSPLVFLKLGGSLITAKDTPQTPRPAVLARLAWEIASSRTDFPNLRLLLGHGSGSFGHLPARRYATRQGVRSPEGWRGFIEVWRLASALHRLVMDALAEAGVPAVSFPPSAAVTAAGGRAAVWNLEPLQAALAAGLVPVVYGDVAFDTELGGTILSTEDLFDYLAPRLAPQRLLLAGIEPGVWADFPTCTRLAETITPASLGKLAPALGGAAAADVTGGMASKVRQSLALCETIPGLEAFIFSGEIPGALGRLLRGETVGTRIHAKDE